MAPRRCEGKALSVNNRDTAQTTRARQTKKEDRTPHGRSEHGFVMSSDYIYVHKAPDVGSCQVHRPGFNDRRKTAWARRRGDRLREKNVVVLSAAFVLSSWGFDPSNVCLAVRFYRALLPERKKTGNVECYPNLQVMAKLCCLCRTIISKFSHYSSCLSSDA